MNEIKTVLPSQLPENIEDLSKFVLIAPQVLAVQRAQIKAMKKIGVVKEVLETKREDMQRAGELYQDAQVRLGRLTREMEKSVAGRHKKICTREVPISNKTNKILELGLNRGTVSKYERMSENLDCVEMEKAHAREQGRLPSTNKTIDLINEKKKRNQEIAGADRMGKLEKINTHNRELEEDYAKKKREAKLVSDIADELWKMNELTISLSEKVETVESIGDKDSAHLIDLIRFLRIDLGSISENLKNKSARKEMNNQWQEPSENANSR